MACLYRIKHRRLTCHAIPCLQTEKEEYKTTFDQLTDHLDEWKKGRDMSIAEQAKHVTSFQQQAGQLMEGLSDMQTLLEEKEFQVCGLWLNSSPESHPCVPVVVASCLQVVVELSFLFLFFCLSLNCVAVPSVLRVLL